MRLKPRLFELTVLKDIIGICYGATVKGMQSYGLERLAAMLMATVKMEELGHLTTEKQEYALRLATVGYPKAGVYSGLIGGATSVLLSAYNRHPLFQPLHTVMRETLFIGSHVVLRELRLNVTTQGPNLALYQLLSTALCSALEIGEVLRGLALGTESVGGQQQIVNVEVVKIKVVGAQDGVLDFLGGDVGCSFQAFLFIITEQGKATKSLIFGKTKDLPDLRGPFSYPSLTSAQSGDYSLVIVTTFVHYANFHNYFVPNLKDMFSRAVTMTAASYARYVLQKLVLLEMKGGCREPELDTETLTTMFEVSVAFFKVGQRGGEHAPPEEAREET